MISCRGCAWGWDDSHRLGHARDDLERGAAGGLRAPVRSACTDRERDHLRLSCGGDDLLDRGAANLAQRGAEGARELPGTAGSVLVCVHGGDRGVEEVGERGRGRENWLRAGICLDRGEHGAHEHLLGDGRASSNR